MKDTPVTIIVPTWNNYQFMRPCAESLQVNKVTEGLYRVIVVNNGEKGSCDYLKANPLFTVIDAGKNLGWEGGLKLGLENTTSEFVIFFNDDAFVPPQSRLWVNKLLQHFRDDKVAAAGPSSNVVMGLQNIFVSVDYHIFKSKFLIGFCMMVRRKALDEVGGVDDTLPGGDDIDLSIRLRDAGYKLIIDRDVFVFHHGFKTGERVHGTSDQSMGWNSVGFTERTNFALIKKHGLKKWYDTIYKGLEAPSFKEIPKGEDTEAQIISREIKGDIVLDLGCGNNKTIKEAIGVDIVPKGQIIETLSGNPRSQADVVADVSQPLPFDDNYCDTIIARHVLEHMIDPIRALYLWSKVLKTGGRMIVAVPNQRKIFSVPMNYEHVHAWDEEAMRVLYETIGLKVVKQLDGENGVSFITVGVKQ